jgi:Ca-activated chloride channel family protein
MPNEIALNVNWGRVPLPAGTAQVAYLLIKAQPQASTTSASTPINFCMVLDRSGSMEGPKMYNLKRAVNEVIATLQPDDQVAVVAFDETADVIVPLQPAADKVALKNRIEALRVQGGTAMSTGLQAGVDQLRSNLSSNRVSHLLLLTDGQTWGDEDDCRAFAQELGQMGVPITALGLGDEWNERLLDDLAAATGGTSDYIANPQDIGQSFKRAAQVAHATVVRNGRLLVRLANGVGPRAVYRVTPVIANLGYQPISEREISVDLGDIQSDTGASLLVELFIPARGAGEYRIAQAELTYDVPHEQRLDQRVRAEALLQITADAHAPQADPRIMNIVERVTAFKLQTRALDEATAGNTSGATQKLRSAATRLLDLGELELADTMNRAADAMETGSGPSAADQKELTYRTRRLTLRELRNES